MAISAVSSEFKKGTVKKTTAEEQNSGYLKQSWCSLVGT